jgi:hypothetical protein
MAIVRLTPPEIRFWSKVERGVGCWLWTARVDRDGYGAFSVSRRIIVRAHRHSWELAFGPPAPGACVLHRCGERRCVNPAHLKLGSAHECDRAPYAGARAIQPQRRRAPRGAEHWTHRRADQVRRGARSHLSKLTAEQVGQIRALYAGGAAIKELADRHGVIPETISNIVHQRTWRDPPATGQGA